MILLFLIELVLLLSGKVRLEQDKMFACVRPEFRCVKDLAFHFDAGSAPVGSRKAQQDRLIFLFGKDFRLFVVIKPVSPVQQEKGGNENKYFHSEMFLNRDQNEDRVQGSNAESLTFKD